MGIFDNLKDNDFVSTYIDTVKMNQQRNKYDSYHFFEMLNFIKVK